VAVSTAEINSIAGNRARARVVALCFVAQNCAVGIPFASFGPMLASTEQHFGVSRTVASSGMSLIMLAMGGLTPVLGALLRRGSVRTGMIVGALLSAVGYWGLAILHSFTLALVMFALIGAGALLTAVIGPLVIINRWFDSDRAKVLSFVNLPIALFLTPYIVARLLPVYGRFAILGTIGTVFLLLAPLLLLLRDRPLCRSPEPVVKSGTALEGPRVGSAFIFKEPAFWLLSIGIGIMVGAGTAYVVHIVPFGMERHMSLPAASAVLSAYSGAGIVGTLLFGWIADRLGPPNALAISAACQTALWWTLLQVNDSWLYLVSALMGACLVPAVALLGAALSRLFDAGAVGRAVGYSYSVKLPFIFVFAPAMGRLFDMSGGYRMPFLLTSGLMVLSTALFLLMSLTVSRSTRSGAHARIRG
jgi:fucose permease